MKKHSKTALYKPTDENMGSLRDLFLYRQSVVDDRQYKLAIAKEKRHISSKSESDNFIYRNSKKGIDLLTKSIQECERLMLEIIKEDEEMYRNYQHRTFHPLMQFLKNDVFDDFIGCLIVGSSEILCDDLIVG